MCSIDLEQCSVFTDTARKARKEHKCDCCARKVLKGETYFKHFSVYDGNVTDEKCCMECNNDRTEFASHRGHMNTNPSSFQNMLYECAAEEKFFDDEEPFFGPMTEHQAEDWRWKDMLQKLEARGTA